MQATIQILTAKSRLASGEKRLAIARLSCAKKSRVPGVTGGCIFSVSSVDLAPFCSTYM